MIRSMTGYGKSETEITDKKIIAEVRSLNSKQLDLSIKIPSVYRQFEQDIRLLANKKIIRGKTDIFITVEKNGVSDAVNINREAFINCFNQITGFLPECGIQRDSAEVNAAIIPVIMKMPEVIQTELNDIGDEEAEALIDTVSKAMNSLNEFRIQEGDNLITDILARIETIENSIPEVEKYEDDRIESIKNRISENFASIGLDYDRNRFEQELIYYLEKLDITEEKVRLRNHCGYFREVCSTEEAPGKKLGFISQEIGREINTLGSKANDSRIQKIVVQMKDELEKIKEQLLNIL
ncbi:MAG: YicC family protein [Rikenellaceae bacterium]|nr:YicC family protein [Rikenellaceae bacterium]